MLQDDLVEREIDGRLGANPIENRPQAHPRLWHCPVSSSPILRSHVLAVFRPMVFLVYIRRAVARSDIHRGVKLRPDGFQN